MAAILTIPAWAKMWAIAFAIFFAAKLASWAAVPGSHPFGWTSAYLLSWPGMNAKAFLANRNSQVNRPTANEWALGFLRVTAGILILSLLPRLLISRSPLLAAWSGMIGIVMTLHFGLFHLLSCGWRSIGIGAAPVMQHPLASQSLAEFWGRRWNTAFRDLAHQFIFRPLSRRVGPQGATIAGFLLSGLIHEAVISWPAGGGYGFPTFYFAIQGAALLSEHSRMGRRLQMNHGWKGRLFCAAVVLLPVNFLFHATFRENVILPMLAAWGALS